jgi:hypothetical protein
MCKLYGIKKDKGGSMKDEKLMDDLRNLLAQTAEMETEAKKKYLDERKRGYSGRIAYGEAKACDLFIRRLTEILYVPEKILYVPKKIRAQRPRRHGC